MTRRGLLLALGAVAPLAAAPAARVRLSIGTYGMQTLPVDRALDAIAAIGYDGAELCIMPGWPSHPAQLDAGARRRIAAHALPIATMIDNLSLTVAEETHRANLDRIRAAAALAHDVARDTPPLLQTVLGGKPGAWDTTRDQMAARLADWARTAGENRLGLAVKAHIGSACDTPEKLLWLLDQVRHPALSAIYDYSHFQLLDLPLAGSLEALLPRASFVTVKDGRLVNGQPRFLLPGDGTVDYPAYFALLARHRFRGWMLVEVSRQLQTQPGYDPLEAARRSYQNLAAPLTRAGLRPAVK